MARLLGEILLDFNLVTQAQLERCLQIQARQEEPRPLGQILVERGYIDEKTLANVLRMQRRGKGDGEAPGPQAAAKAFEVASAADLLRVARDMEASDLFLTPGEKPMVRLFGSLADLPAEPLDEPRCAELVRSLLTPAQIQHLEEHGDLDASISLADAGRFRLNVFRHFRGIAAVFRVIDGRVRPFEDLGLPDVVRDFADLKQGLVLITGPTGSGKSTTLASLVHMVNERYRLHVITLEDPIEVVFKSRESLVTQREIHTHSESYAAALRAALREDPDIVVVGELRDPETTATALTAAETGHLVFATLHTRDAHSTVLRVVEQFPPHKRSHVRTVLAGVLRAVVCQELVPRRDGRGYVLASEVMLVDAAIANLIRENRPWQIPMVMQMAAGRGMKLMDESLEELLRTETITLEEAQARAVEKERFGATA